MSQRKSFKLMTSSLCAVVCAWPLFGNAASSANYTSDASVFGAPNHAQIQKAMFYKTSREFGPHRLFKFIHQLDLSREQREQIGLIMDEHRPRMREFMLDMMDAKKQLQAILQDAEYDSSAIEQLASEQAKNAEQMFLNTAKAFADVNAVLTPKQRQKIAEKMEKRRGFGHRPKHHLEHHDEYRDGRYRDSEAL